MVLVSFSTVPASGLWGPGEGVSSQLSSPASSQATVWEHLQKYGQTLTFSGASMAIPRDKSSWLKGTQDSHRFWLSQLLWQLVEWLTSDHILANET